MREEGSKISKKFDHLVYGCPLRIRNHVIDYKNKNKRTYIKIFDINYSTFNLLIMIDLLVAGGADFSMNSADADMLGSSGCKRNQLPLPPKNVLAPLLL